MTCLKIKKTILHLCDVRYYKNKNTVGFRYNLHPLAGGFTGFSLNGVGLDHQIKSNQNLFCIMQGQNQAHIALYTCMPFKKFDKFRTF